MVRVSNFINNTASENGGAVFFGPVEGDTITNCLFENNKAGINGGAIDFKRGTNVDFSNGSTKATISNSKFNNNIANRSAGAVYWFGTYGTIKDSNFTNNKALGITEAEDSYGNRTYGGYGGAIMWTGANGTVTNCRFISNEAEYNAARTSGGRGGAIYLQGSEAGNCTNTTFDKCTFISNIAGTNGGAKQMVVQYTGEVTMVKSKILTSLTILLKLYVMVVMVTWVMVVQSYGQVLMVL